MSDGLCSLFVIIFFIYFFLFFLLFPLMVSRLSCVHSSDTSFRLNILTSYSLHIHLVHVPPTYPPSTHVNPQSSVFICLLASYLAHLVHFVFRPLHETAHTHSTRLIHSFTSCRPIPPLFSYPGNPPQSHRTYVQLISSLTINNFFLTHLTHFVRKSCAGATSIPILHSVLISSRLTQP